MEKFSKQRREHDVATKCTGWDVARRFLEHDHAACAEFLLHCWGEGGKGEQGGRGRRGRKKVK